MAVLISRDLGICFSSLVVAGAARRGKPDPRVDPSKD